MARETTHSPTVPYRHGRQHVQKSEIGAREREEAAQHPTHGNDVGVAIPRVLTRKSHGEVTVTTSTNLATSACHRIVMSADELADLRARLASSEERAANLAAQLKAIQLAAPPDRLPPPIHLGVAAALAAAESTLLVDSPSKAGSPSIQDTLAHLGMAAAPLTPALAPLTVAPSLSHWAACARDEALREASALRPATSHVPEWIVIQPEHAPAALSLFLPRGCAAAARPRVPGATLPWNCHPELPTAVREPFHPAYNGEFKSAMSTGDKDRLKMFDELLTYCMLGMLGSCFQGVPVGTHRFFRVPPYAFGLTAFPHVGYLIAVEWVGKLLASIVSEPFFLGSLRHAEAVRALPDCDFSMAGYVDLRVDDVPVRAWAAQPGSRPGVLWRAEAPPSDGGNEAACFFKIVRGEAFDAAHFRRMHAAYARLAEVWRDVADPPPAALVNAQLLYGAGEVCVRMPWVDGRDAAPGDLAPGGCAVRPVAAAIAWLARHGLLYTDLREPNVRVGGDERAPRVTLLDYDDMQRVEPPPASAEELCALLARAGALYAGAEGEPGARPAVVAALRAGWGAWAVGAGGV